MNRLARHLSPVHRVFLAAGLLLTPAALVLGAVPAHAQQTYRTVNGQVTDKGGAPVKGAVVHLKETKSLAMRSYITAEDGQYKFAQLSTNADYEVWADSEGKKSDSKSISSFDNKSSATINLKVQ
jgi:Carboxypeptidase regulatory-like domain